MSPDTVIAICVFVVLVAGVLGVLVYTTVTTRPYHPKQLHRGHAIVDMIDRYDEAQENNWVPWGRQTFAGVMSVRGIGERLLWRGRSGGKHYRTRAR